MSGTTVPYQIVLFTRQHAISGGVFINDVRLSDYLNDRRDSNIHMRNASVARLENPARVLEKTLFSVIPKEGIVLAFEPPQKNATLRRGIMKYPKEKYEVFLILDSMEIQGHIHVQGNLDLLNIMTNVARTFLPITSAKVTIEGNFTPLLNGQDILVNAQLIRFIGEVQSRTEPAAPSALPSNGDGE